jgi:hypothetical protein
MNKRIVPRWQSLGFKLLVLVLAMSGFAQMPIFKRYYIADIPGLGWLAQFYTTHIVHYIAAIIFLALIFYYLSRYFLEWNKNYHLRLSAWPRLSLFAIIIITGALRVAKNLPDVHFGPTTTMLLDWIHLFAVIVLGLTALITWLARRSPYLLSR